MAAGQVLVGSGFYGGEATTAMEEKVTLAAPSGWATAFFLLAVVWILMVATARA